MITPRIMPRPGLLGMAATPVEFSPMSKSRLAGVAPGLSDLMTEVERRALASGIRLQVSEGMRDANRQAGLVAAGKSQTMKSKHLTGNAVDVNIVNPDGSVNWDFEAYRPVAEIAKQVAAERGLPNFVWGGDWKTLKDGVHFQLGGASQPPQTEVAAMAGGNGVPSLLGGGAQDQLAPEPKKGLLGFLSNPDARARLAIALEGMTLNPNEAFMQSMQQGIQTRGETKAATEAKNKTAAWLRSQGREDLAAAVEGGIVSGSDAFAAMKPGEPVKGVSVGNNLVNPITGQLIYAGQPEVKPGFRIATPDEAKAYGAASGQFGPDGRFYAADSGGMVVYGPDGQPIMTTGGAVPKPFTEAQSKDVVFATRAKGALEALDPVAGELTSRMSRAAEYDPTGIARGMVQSDKFQLAKNAGDEFLQALLRKDSGAAITEGEQALYGVTYLPQPGDSAALIEQKTAARQRAVAAIEAGMSPAQIIAQEQAVASGGKAPAPTGPAKISSDAEYDALPSGSEFVGPDGVKRRKP